MKIFLVEADPHDVVELMDTRVFRRAIVVSIDASSAVNCVSRGLRGHPVFSGLRDKGRYSRTDGYGYFNPDKSLVTEIGEEPVRQASEILGTRIIAWEVCPPEAEL